MTNYFNDFQVVGLNHKIAPMQIRERFALTDDLCETLINQVNEKQLGSVVPVATCNRVELYYVGDKINELIDALCQITNTNLETFRQYGFQFRGFDTVNHLFRVASGLESQVLGDFQIKGQLRTAYDFAKSLSLDNSLINRVFEAAFKASKQIKNTTELSSGTTSVSYAAVVYLKENFPNLARKKIAVIGSGKVGSLVTNELLKILPAKNLHLLNRSIDKLDRWLSYDVRISNIQKLEDALLESDIVIIATGAQSSIVTKSMLSEKSSMTLLDLSVPRNVDETVKELPGITLVDIDELSTIVNSSFQLREQSITKAERIIEEEIKKLHSNIQRAHFTKVISGQMHASLFGNELEVEDENFHSQFLNSLAVNHLNKVRQVS